MKGKQPVREYRLCVLGPSFVGKTQLINRFINNGFSPYYEPTLHAQVYKRAFNLLDTENAADIGVSDGDQQQFVQVEIIDVFPHDHPALDAEIATPGEGGTPGEYEEEDQQTELAREMSTTLNAIVKNNLEGKLGSNGSGILGKIHGFIYVYDASNKNTFDTLSCLIDTVREIEKSDRRGKKVVTYTPKIITQFNNIAFNN